MAPKKTTTILQKAKQLRGVLRELDNAAGTKLAWTAETQAEVAEFFEVSVDTVKNWAKQKMPGKPRNYRLDKIAVWLRTEGPGSRAIRSADDDPLLSGDSPALERYRLAKAKHAELDLEHRKGELIEVNNCRDILARWAVLIRQMGDALAKRYGNEAAVTVNDALAECRSVVEDGFGAD